MDPVTQFITAWKIPIGAWGKAFFTFLTDNFNVFFEVEELTQIIQRISVVIHHDEPYLFS